MAISLQALQEGVTTTWFTITRTMRPAWVPLWSSAIFSLFQLLPQVRKLASLEVGLQALFGYALFFAFICVIWHATRVRLSLADYSAFSAEFRASKLHRVTRVLAPWYAGLLPALALMLTQGPLESHWLEAGLVLLAVAAAIAFTWWRYEQGGWQGLRTFIRHPHTYIDQHDTRLLRVMPINPMGVAFLTITILLVTVVQVVPEVIPRIGTMAWFVTGFMCWTVILTWLSAQAEHTKFPVLALVVITLLVVSHVWDRHGVQRLESRTAGLTPIPNTCTEPSRPLLIAAEGGGIRAAYWTFSVLTEWAKLEQAQGRNLLCEIATISTVSGSNLGAALFYTGYLQQATQHTTQEETIDYDQLLQYGQGFLAEDYLATIAAGLFFSDFLGAIPGLHDRAKFLEDAWVSYSESPDSQLSLALGTRELHTLANGRLPNLVMNTTRVENGAAEHAGFGGAVTPQVLRALPDIDLSLASAAHLGARFPAVSPVGKLTDDARYVDGGYYDNYGLTALRGLPGRVVLITNGGQQLNNGQAPRPTRFWETSEITMPLLTYARTADARAQQTLQELDRADRVVEAPLVTVQPVLLGWTLDRDSIEVMNRAAREVAVSLTDRLDDDPGGNCTYSRPH